MNNADTNCEARPVAIRFLFDPFEAAPVGVRKGNLEASQWALGGGHLTASELGQYQPKDYDEVLVN